jgi:hypothetical protein
MNDVNDLEILTNYDLQPFYEKFIQKLGELSSLYELEKAALEQTMLHSLQQAQSGHYGLIFLQPTLC